MEPQSDRAFHLERAKQCRSMASESSDPVVRRLHEELAEFHDLEAERGELEVPMNQEPA